VSPAAHQPQPACELQSVQLPLNRAQNPRQLPGHLANALPEHEPSAEPPMPSGMHCQLLVQNPHPSLDAQSSQVVNVVQGSPTIAVIGNT
jgi:hypothetical protein